MNYNPAPLWARIFLICIIRPGWTLIVLILIGAAIAKCTEKKIDPIDNHYNKSKSWVGSVVVLDSARAGFEVHLQTKNYVTAARAKEILHRKHIREDLNKLKEEAPEHFHHDLMAVDIYDFAQFALNYVNDPDTEILRIFVYGKRALEYFHPNPNIKNSATWGSGKTKQGLLYIDNLDIYYCRDKSNRTYRYWKCYGLHAISSVDERFSHFSEDDRIQP